MTTLHRNNLKSVSNKKVIDLMQIGETKQLYVRLKRNNMLEAKYYKIEILYEFYCENFNSPKPSHFKIMFNNQNANNYATVSVEDIVNYRFYVEGDDK